MRQVLRMRALSDEDLASSVLFLARQARRRLAAHVRGFDDTADKTRAADRAYLTHLIPSACANLNPRLRLREEEFLDSPRSPNEIRDIVESIHGELSYDIFGSHTSDRRRFPSSVDILGRPLHQGNPVLEVLQRTTAEIDGSGRSNRSSEAQAKVVARRPGSPS